MKLTTEYLERLTTFEWKNIPMYRHGEFRTQGEREDLALSIQRIAKRALGSTEEFRTSKLVFVNNEWIYR